MMYGGKKEWEDRKTKYARGKKMCMKKNDLLRTEEVILQYVIIDK